MFFTHVVYGLIMAQMTQMIHIWQWWHVRTTQMKRKRNIDAQYKSIIQSGHLGNFSESAPSTPLMEKAPNLDVAADWFLNADIDHP